MRQDLVPTNEDLIARLPARDQKFLKLMGKGYHPKQIAKKVSPTNPDKRKRLIRHMYLLAELSEDFQRMQAMAAKGAQIVDLVDIVEAVNRKARAGRVDAAKLTFESSGFHNPKMQHEHSGEVSIKITTVPRPERAVDVTDADVVEE